MDLDFAFLSRTALFLGASPEETEAILTCLAAETRTYEKGQMIYRAGDTAVSLGLVLSGRILIVHDDFWGNTTVLDSAGPDRSRGNLRLHARGAYDGKRGGGGGFPGAISEREPNPTDLLPLLRASQPPDPEPFGPLCPQEPESFPENLLHSLQVRPGPPAGLSL